MEEYHRSLNNIMNYNSLAWGEDELVSFKQSMFETFNDLMMQDLNPLFVRIELEKYVVNYYAHKIVSELLNSQDNECCVYILHKYKCAAVKTYDVILRLSSYGLRITDQGGKIIIAQDFRSGNPNYEVVIEHQLMPLIKNTLTELINMEIYERDRL